MKFKGENLYLFVEGMQFINGVYETSKENEIKILKKYSDRISVIEEEKVSKVTKKTEE